MWKVALSLGVTACLLAAAPFVFRQAKKRKGSFLGTATITAAMAMLIGRTVEQASPTSDWTEPYRPIQVAGPGDAYSASDSCRDCHREQYDSWHASYHRTMTQIATPETVLGRFDDVRTSAYGHSLHLSRRGDQYWATMHDPESPVTSTSPLIERPIVMTTGSHHMQVYWYASSKDRRLGQLPVVWVQETENWVPIHSIFLRPPQTKLGRAEGRWNQTCIKCHATQGRPRFTVNASTLSCDSHVAEFGIACEACHGPGSRHVHDHQANAAKKHALVDPSTLDHRRSTEVCGQCHGYWSEKDAVESTEFLWNGLTYRPGDRLEDTRHVFAGTEPMNPHVQARLDADPNFMSDRFWKDGMVRVSGREYNGLMQSPCYTDGTISCISCHSMHPDEDVALSSWANDQLGAGMDGNQACLQCHEKYRSEDRLRGHTHHAYDSSGSLCYNCHMPHTTFGLLKAIRSHQISSPHVQETVALGRPNACTQCHMDKTVRWAAGVLHDWYGIEPPARIRDDHNNYAATLVAALKGDAGQRALAAWTLGWPAALEASRSDWAVPILLQLLDDPYDAVRYVARRSLLAYSEFRELDIDPFASPAQRRARIATLLARWNREPVHRAPNPSLLIGPGGKLMLDRLQTLLDKRDHRIVVLAE